MIRSIWIPFASSIHSTCGRGDLGVSQNHCRNNYWKIWVKILILESYVCVNKELRDKSPNLHSSDDYRCSGLGLSRIRAKGDKFSTNNIKFTRCHFVLRRPVRLFWMYPSHINNICDFLACTKTLKKLCSSRQLKLRNLAWNFE